MRKILVAASIGLAAAALAALAYRLAFFEDVESKTYDWRVRLVADGSAAHRDIVLVLIDDTSILKLAPQVGRWPWPRLVHAQLINYLARSPAKVVGYDILFGEPDRASYTIGGEQWTGQESDAALADAVRSSGSVVVVGDVSAEVAEETRRATSAAAPPDTGYPVGELFEARSGIQLPFKELMAAARAVGHNLLVLDRDGPVRRAVPFVRVEGRAIPSLPVAVAAVAAGVAPRSVQADGNTLVFGGRRLALVQAAIATPGEPVEHGRRALVNFRGPTSVGGRSTFQAYSFYDLFYSEQQLLAGEKPFVDPSIFRDRIVLVGTTAAGLHDVFTVPFAQGKMPGVEIHANVVDNLLSSGFVRETPIWASVLAYAVTGLGAAFACVLLGIWTGLAAAVLVLAGAAGGAAALFGQATWLPAAGPLSGGALAAFGGIAYQYFVEGREKRKVKHLFSRFVSPDVFAHLMADPSRARLGGERRAMSVLFSDIRGFTTFTEAGKPEEVVQQLNEFFSRMVEVIFAHGGTLDKFVGDMVMALFGAPLDDSDHADHAVTAAVAMRAALDELNARWVREGKRPLDIGIGVNSGEMVAGIIGAETIMSYTVIGDAVNLGARLESLNKEYGTHIIISEATRSQLKRRYDSRRLGEVTVKGKTRPVEIFEVRGPADGGERSAGLPGGPEGGRK